MAIADYLLTGLMSVLLGLDRTAVLQAMLARPLVAAPLTGLLLGVPLAGLQVGILLELLWLARLPVGTVIPPDDTQIAVGATLLTVTAGRLLGLEGMPAVILCVLTAIPLGQCGRYADLWARRANDRLGVAAVAAAARGEAQRVERLHLRGALHFALAGLFTCAVIVAAGTLILALVAPLLIDAVRAGGAVLQYSFTLIGAGVLLGTLNVSRGSGLFAMAFAATLLGLWLW